MKAMPKVCRVPAEKILGNRAFKNHFYMLEKIERHGADRQSLVNLLALAATASDNRYWWREAIRGRIAALRSLSTRLQAVSHDSTKLLDDPFTRVGVWSAFILGNPPATDPTKKSPIASLGCAVLRSFAEGAAKQASALGHFLRQAGRKYDRMGKLILLYYVDETTKGMVFDEELAMLLNDAFAALQESERVTPETLRKLRERYPCPLIRIR